VEESVEAQLEGPELVFDLTPSITGSFTLTVFQA
jgi:hypothetical protein